MMRGGPPANCYAMNKTLDALLRKGKIYFLPWIGDQYEPGFCGRRFLLLGESHYACWDGQRHDLGPTSTRVGVTDVVTRQDGARFYKNIEQALLNEERLNGWCPGGGPALWNHFAFYNYVQSPVLGPPRTRPSQQQFDDSLALFTAVLEALRPERVLVCGKRLWGKMATTQVQAHHDVQAYELSDRSRVWCLAIKLPSCGGFSWRRTHPLIKAFLREPQDAASMLVREARAEWKRRKGLKRVPQVGTRLTDNRSSSGE